jgi:hypothetical protein
LGDCLLALGDCSRDALFRDSGLRGTRTGEPGTALRGLLHGLLALIDTTCPDTFLAEISFEGSPHCMYGGGGVAGLSRLLLSDSTLPSGISEEGSPPGKE